MNQEEISSSNNWSVVPFLRCYCLIKVQNHLSYKDIKNIKLDLCEILTTPTKNEKSRKKLMDINNTVIFSNGEKFKLNQSFIEGSLALSYQLDLDELIAAELLHYSNELSFQKGTSFIDSGLLSYFQRNEYILNILGWLFLNNKLDMIFENSFFETFSLHFIQSFEKIYNLLSIINDSIDKQKVISNINEIQFINRINYIQTQLFKNHENLGKIYYLYIDRYYYKIDSFTHFNEILKFTNQSLLSNDLLLVHYLPGTFKLLTKVFDDKNNDELVLKFHDHITKKLDFDYKVVYFDSMVDLSKSNLKSLNLILYLFFLTKFIKWCKMLISQVKKIDFKDNILKYIEWLLNYGVMEIFMCFTAETCNHETHIFLEYGNFYDFRSLLQKTYPKLEPVKFFYPKDNELIKFYNLKYDCNNIYKLIDKSTFKISLEFTDELLSLFFHSFIVEFISSAAFVLIQLRDKEEDFFLSTINQTESKNFISNDNENLTIRSESITSNTFVDLNDTHSDKNNKLDFDENFFKSDLERFYLAFSYTYTNRPNLCNLLWSNEDISIDLDNFIVWGVSNNTSSLVTASFCLLLASLASGGDDSALKIWEILSNDNNFSLQKNDYSRISVYSIIESLNYYILSLNQKYEKSLNDQFEIQKKKHEVLFSQYNESENFERETKTKTLIELSEDSLIFISGFIQLISNIVKNLSNKKKSIEIKKTIFNKFYAIIEGFLKFDNLITKQYFSLLNTNFYSSNKSKIMNTPNIVFNEDNRIILTNLILDLLTNFIYCDKDLELRYKIWRLLDIWIYHNICNNLEKINDEKSTSVIPFKQSQNKTKLCKISCLNIDESFNLTLIHFSQVYNFLRLIEHLLKPYNNTDNLNKFSLLYPLDLGSGYRFDNQYGIFPYIKYILLNVFSKSESLKNIEEKQLIQFLIIKIILNSLIDFDWLFVKNFASFLSIDSTSFDNFFDSLIPNINLSFFDFINFHHSIFVLNCLFEEKFYKNFLQIIILGIDQINFNNNVNILVEKSLKLLDKILELNDFFTNELLQILRNKVDYRAIFFKKKDSKNFKSDFVSKKHFPFINSNLIKSNVIDVVLNFYEIILVNFLVINVIAIYIGSSNFNIAEISIKILSKINSSSFLVSNSTHSYSEHLLKKNRLLTIFETSQESVKIKYAFINQFQNFDDNLNIQFILLHFLDDVLNGINNDSPNICHFLLGYEIRGDNLIFFDYNRNTLLKTLLDLLVSNIFLLSQIFEVENKNFMFSTNILKFSSMILSILLKLCHDTCSSNCTLNYTRDFGLFEKLIRFQPLIDINNLLNLNNNLDLDKNNDSNLLLKNNLKSKFYYYYIKTRTFILQYLSLDYHHIDSITKKEIYLKTLLDKNHYVNNAPRIFNFLNDINHKSTEDRFPDFENLNHKYNLSFIIETMQDNGAENFDFNIINKLTKLLCQNYEFNKKNEFDKLVESIHDDIIKIKKFSVYYLITNNIKKKQITYLKSWCQLIKILITDHSLNLHHFICMMRHNIIPKLSCYLDSNIHFTENLASLCVLLFDSKNNSLVQNVENDKFVLETHKLFLMINTCVSGILNSNSTSSLRSDFYILLKNFIVLNFQNEKNLREIYIILKSVDKKFIEIIFNDFFSLEKIPKISSILLLESLMNLTLITKTNFFLETLIKNNYLLVLIRSIKRIDEIIKSCSKENSETTLSTLSYELILFKIILYFLIRVSQSKIGALNLIQNDIILILKELTFLKIDPDWGVTLEIKEFYNHKTLKIKFLLNSPHILNELTKKERLNDINTISYFEFLIPVFQLMCTIVASMGPTYNLNFNQFKGLFNSSNKLITGIMKRDFLIENYKIESEIQKTNENISKGLKELVNLLVLLKYLTKSD